MTAPRLTEQDSNSIIEDQLDSRLREVEDATDADALTYIGPIIEYMHDILREAIEDIDPRRKKLVVILETLDIDETVRGNPQVDAAQFREVQELIGELRRHGVGPREYSLGSPYQQRPLERQHKDEAKPTAHRQY